MARPRELLSLASIADETGISYATLRNYALKYSDEIPSEGIGRSTRYPRSAVKIFQRLRRESKPGRKPRSAYEDQAPLPVTPSPVVPLPVRQEAPREVSRPEPIDRSGIERELASIRVYLGSIAQSLEQLAREPKSTTAEVSPEAPVQAPVAGSVAVVPEAEKRPEAPVLGASERLPVPPVSREENQGPGGSHRRLHSLPKVMGQRGRRPE
jgi:hypothetical protein